MIMKKLEKQGLLLAKEKEGRWHGRYRHLGMVKSPGPLQYCFQILAKKLSCG
jgi:hypothetical protein